MNFGAFSALKSPVSGRVGSTESEDVVHYVVLLIDNAVLFHEVVGMSVLGC